MSAQAPSSREIDRFRDRADRFIADLDEEYYLHYAGLKDTLDVEQLYERHELVTGVPTEPLTRYFEYWLLRLQGVYPPPAVLKSKLSAEAIEFLNAAGSRSPQDLIGCAVERTALRELEGLHRSLISMHLEREPRSIKVLKEMNRS